MPMKAVCEKCGNILYEGAEIKAPYEIVASYEGKCPKCAKRLLQTPGRVEISPVSAA